MVSIVITKKAAVERITQIICMSTIRFPMSLRPHSPRTRSASTREANVTYASPLGLPSVPCTNCMSGTTWYLVQTHAYYSWSKFHHLTSAYRLETFVMTLPIRFSLSRDFFTGDTGRPGPVVLSSFLHFSSTSVFMLSSLSSSSSSLNNVYIHQGKLTWAQFSRPRPSTWPSRPRTGRSTQNPKGIQQPSTTFIGQSTCLVIETTLPTNTAYLQFQAMILYAHCCWLFFFYSFTVYNLFFSVLRFFWQNINMHVIYFWTILKSVSLVDHLRHILQ